MFLKSWDWIIERRAHPNTTATIINNNKIPVLGGSQFWFENW